MAKLGRYTDLPLPNEWLPILDKLRPLNVQLNCSETPDVGALIDAFFGYLDKREQEVLLYRYGRGETLQKVGDKYDLTRERVRQIEKKSFRKLKAVARELSISFGDYLELAKSSGLVVSKVPDCSSAVAPDFLPDELWFCAFKILKETRYKQFETKQLPSGRWITLDAKKKLRPKALKSFLLDKRQFVSLEEVAAFLEIEPYDLIHAYTYFDGVFITREGKVGMNKWRMPESMEAIAWELAYAGFTEWHFSEMAKALDHVFPDRFSNTLGRNVAAVLSRSNETSFQSIGQKGMWQLSEIGDGFANNKAAVIAVMKRSNKLLHYTEITNSLDRSVRQETIYALLSRDNTFKGYGDGIYGLAEPKSKNTSTENELDNKVADFILDLFAKHSVLPVGSDDSDK